MKKALILFHSVYGNTKKVAMSISRGLEAGGLYVDCHSIEKFNLSKIIDYNLIGIGGPTHFHGASKKMKNFLSKIKHIKLNNKYGFAFGTKADFPLAGSATKRITRSLKKMGLKIVYPSTLGFVLEKEGPLEESVLNNMEKIGLSISENLSKDIMLKNVDRKSQKKRIKNHNRLNRVFWFLLAGGSLFFFIRAIYMSSTGGDSFGNINPYLSWLFLISEITFSLIAALIGTIKAIISLFLESNVSIKEPVKIPKILLISGVSAYSLHFIRVAIWIAFFII